MNDASKIRLAANEKVFRQENERADKLLSNIVDEKDELSFVCECSQDSCRERILLTSAQFEELHSSPRIFVIKPDHETVEVEKVTLKTERYWLVEKFVAP